MASPPPISAERDLADRVSSCVAPMKTYLDLCRGHINALRAMVKDTEVRHEVAGLHVCFASLASEVARLESEIAHTRTPRAVKAEALELHPACHPEEPALLPTARLWPDGARYPDHKMAAANDHTLEDTERA